MGPRLIECRLESTSDMTCTSCGLFLWGWPHTCGWGSPPGAPRGAGPLLLLACPAQPLCWWEGDGWKACPQGPGLTGRDPWGLSFCSALCTRSCRWFDNSAHHWGPHFTDQETETHRGEVTRSR